MNSEQNANEFLKDIIDPTDLIFRRKVKSKNSLVSFDIETLTLPELLESYRQLKMSDTDGFPSDEEMCKKYTDLREEIGMYEAIPKFAAWLISKGQV